ncbi:MAG: hypothetical protein Q9160_006473 [Pyrenula sp. 1 TL-2023]
MAPGVLTETSQAASQHPTKHSLPAKDFPSGFKSSGQHPPLYDHLAPYSSFPKHISGPTAWGPSTYQSRPESWIHPLTDAEISDLSTAADNFISSDRPLSAITPETYPLPVLQPVLQALRSTLLDDRGFILFKRFPTPATHPDWSVLKTAIAYLGLSTHLGLPVSQNGLGHILGHVKDLGDDPTAIDRVRIYRTNARQYFHADDSDLVGLLCLARAQEGGESDLCSSNQVWNVLQAERPDIAEKLTRPDWYFDRKGEVSKGEQEYIKNAVFYLEKEERGKERRVYCKYDPYFLWSMTRFADAGIVPPLSPEQKEAMTVLEETCQRLALHMILEVGDVQFLSNAQVLHARTAYRDWDVPGKDRRWLMRVWLATSEGSGGWRLPFKDSAEEKRGGIQVDDVPERCPLDAE